MIKVLFVCHGNICRSPMAEFIMKDLVKKAGLEQEFHIESASHRIGRHQHRGDRQPGLSSGPPEAGPARHQLRGQAGPAAAAGGLWGLGPAHRHGPGQHPEYAPHLRRRSGGKAPSDDGVCRRTEWVPARAQRSGSRGERRSKGAFGVFAAGGNGEKRTLLRRGGRSLVHRGL